MVSTPPDGRVCVAPSGVCFQASAEPAKDGVSRQSMAIRNRDGQPIALGMQSVAIFV